MSNNLRFRKSQASISNIERSAFKSLSHSYKTSFNVGELIPILVQEVLPGDEFKIDTSIVGRLQTPLAPAMDDLYLEYFYFFVPTRLVWDDWKYFMGEQKSAWLDDNVYKIPSIPLNARGSTPINRYSFADYLGIPPGAYPEVDIPISVLPHRAYVKIWNEWFRDQNLQDPLLEYSGNANVSNEAARMFSNTSTTGILKVNKRHDYFTSALPGPQKGPNVHIPFGDVLLPVVTGDDLTNANKEPLRWIERNSNAAADNGYLGNKLDSTVILPSTLPGDEVEVIPGNLWADGTYGSFGAPTINALRLAFQIQKIYEKDARSGSRYVEIIRSHFGVVSPDARQQRPEYLGGGIERIGMQQQVATTAGSDGESEANMLGTVGAYSYTQHSKYNFNKAFTEHGFIIGLATLRYTHTYTQGIPKYLTRQDRFDFYDPTLAHLGEQPIMKSELYIEDHLSYSDLIWGYNEAWADYRYNPNRATADMRPGPDMLGHLWHYGDYYTQEPFLSANWIKEDKSNVERTLALSSDVVKNFYCDIYFNIYAKRPMPLYSIPGLIDHF
ncbi:MAG: major capsid protein [Sulfolobaceae archaeon]